MLRPIQAPTMTKKVSTLACMAIMLSTFLTGCGTDQGPVTSQGPDVDYHQAIRPQNDRARAAGAVMNPAIIGDKAPDIIYPEPVAGDERPRTRPVKVAMLLPLTGQGANIGQAMMRAAEIATFQLADDNFTLLPFDTHSTAEGARAAIDAAIAQNVELVLGPLFASDVAAVREPARAAGLNVIAFTTDRQQARDNVFVSGFVPSSQIDRIIGFAQGKGIKTFGILAPEGIYGDAVLAAARDSIEKHGGAITRLTRYKPDTADLRPVAGEFANLADRQQQQQQVRDRLAASNLPEARRALNDLQNQPVSSNLPYQAVLVADGGNRLAILAPLLQNAGLTADKVQWLGTGLWDSPDSWSIPALKGAWYAAPASAARRDFETRFRDGFGAAPPRIASLAYDATALAAILARQDVDLYSTDKDVRQAAWTSQIYRKDVLANPNGFMGADGIFRFLPDGTAERGLAVLEISPEGPITRDAAPESFVAPGF